MSFLNYRCFIPWKLFLHACKYHRKVTWISIWLHDTCIYSQWARLDWVFKQDDYTFVTSVTFQIVGTASSTSAIVWSKLCNGTGSCITQTEYASIRFPWNVTRMLYARPFLLLLPLACFSLKNSCLDFCVVLCCVVLLYLSGVCVVSNVCICHLVWILMV